MSAGVRWSVIVPSHNGADTLPACLEALARVRRPSEGIEIILVDNASTDGTAGLMRAFAIQEGASFLSEPRQGKSYALNAAIERAAGEMLVFLDDDVIADGQLIDAYARAGAQFPEAKILAGQVRPAWQATPPEWLRSLTDAGRSAGCTPIGREDDWLGPRDVKGCNMAVRRKAIGHRRFATGDVNFGAGPRTVGGEDTEFARRVAPEGEIRYVSGAKVAHIVAPDEMRWRSVFSRYVRIGRGNAAQGLATPAVLPLIAQAAVYAGLAALVLAFGRKRAAANQSIKLAMRIGALDYLLRSRADP